MYKIFPDLIDGKALVISGPQGSGKTMLARAIASQYGSCRSVQPADLDSLFRLSGILHARPSVVIIEPFWPLTEKQVWALKGLIAHDDAEIHRKHCGPEIVPTPRIILAGCYAQLQGIPRSDRRFWFIETEGMYHE